MLADYNAVMADMDVFFRLAVLLAVFMAVLYLVVRGFIGRVHVSHGLILAGIALMATLFGLSAHVMSYDEAFTAAITDLPLDQIVPATIGGVYPPAYYVVIRVMRSLLGDSEFVLRLWSALCAGTAVVFVYQIGCRFLDRRRALRAGYVAALLPGLLAFGQTARMYSMLAALVLIAFWAALNDRWLLFVGAAGLAIYTHNYGWLYLLAMTPFWITKPRGRVAAAAVVCLCLPWLVGGLLRQLAHVDHGFWITPITFWRLFEPALMLGTGYNAPPLVTLGLLAVFLFLTGAGLWSIHPAHVTGLHEALSQRKLPRWARRRATLWSILVVPILLAAIVSIVFRPVYLSRGFIPGVYLLPICWVMWLAHRPVWIKVGAAVALTVAVVYVVYPASAVLDIRDLVAEADIQPDDQVYYVEIASLISLEYYVPEADHYLFPYTVDPSQTFADETRSILGLRSVDYDDLPEPEGRRLLVVCETPFTTLEQQAEIDRLVGEPGMRRIAQIGDRSRNFVVYEDTIPGRG